jgi:2,3-bisphosphoglycerate-dependent phosphoglycerate mutase
MKTTDVYFVRHAHSPFSLENEETRGLSEKGWKDANKVTEILAGEGITHILSSPYIRAIQTVEGLAKLLQKEVEIDIRFREGCLARRDYYFENPEVALKYALENPTFSFPGGESTLEVQKRGIAALTEALHKYKRGKIAIGIHGYIMTTIMNYFDKKYDFEFSKSTTKPDIYKLTITDDLRLLKVERMWNTKNIEENILNIKKR